MIARCDNVLSQRFFILEGKMKNDFLFKHVICSAALYEIHNGVGFSRGENGDWFFTTEENTLKKINWNNDPVKRLSKNYIVIKRIHFSGFIVGIKSIRSAADLVIEKQKDNKYMDVKIWRENEEFRQVAIVYYANNRKRLVPLEYCEIL